MKGVPVATCSFFFFFNYSLPECLNCDFHGINFRVCLIKWSDFITQNLVSFGIGWVVRRSSYSRHRQWFICFCQNPIGMILEIMTLPRWEYLSWVSWSQFFSRSWRLEVDRRLDYGFVTQCLEPYIYILFVTPCYI